MSDPQNPEVKNDLSNVHPVEKKIYDNKIYLNEIPF